MRKFKDSTGYEWDINLPFGEIVRVKRESGGEFDLLSPMNDKESKLAEILDSNLEKFYELLCYLVTPQFGKLDCTDVAKFTACEFGQRVASDVLIAAQKQFFLEWSDFFRFANRPEIAAVVEALAKVRAKAVETVSQRIREDRILPGIADRMVPKFNEVLTKSFKGLEDSLESILTLTPGETSTAAPKGYD